MNKKLLVGIVLILIMAFIGLVFGTITTIRYVRFNKIYKVLEEYVSEESYSLITEVKYKDASTVTEMHYLNGTGKTVAANGVYTWNDGKKAYMLDEENKIIKALKAEEMVGLALSDTFAQMVPGYSKSFIDKLFFAADLSNKISTEKINDIKYYIIEVSDENSTKRIWISSKLGYLVKAEVEFPNKDIFYYDYTMSIGNTHKADVTLPDITEYKLVSGDLEIDAKNFLDE